MARHSNIKMRKMRKKQNIFLKFFRAWSLEWKCETKPFRSLWLCLRRQFYSSLILWLYNSKIYSGETDIPLNLFKHKFWLWAKHSGLVEFCFGGVRGRFCLFFWCSIFFFIWTMITRSRLGCWRGRCLVHHSGLCLVHHSGVLPCWGVLLFCFKFSSTLKAFLWFYNKI